MKLAILALVSLASAGFVRAEEPVPVVVPPSDNGGSNYISVGPTYGRANFSDTAGLPSDLKNFYGVTFNYGRYFGESSVGVHEVSVQAAALGAYDKSGSVRTTLGEAPVLASYNYNFKLGDTTKLYIGPRVGFAVTTLGIDDHSNDFDQIDSDVAFRFGAGIGIRQRFTAHFGMAIGYEYSRTGSTSYSLSDSGTTINASLGHSDMHALVISAAWEF